MAEEDAGSQRRSLIIFSKEASASTWGTTGVFVVSVLALGGAVALIVMGYPWGTALVALPVTMMVQAIAGSERGKHGEDDGV